VKSTFTLKPVLGVTQDHWKWRNSIDRTWLY